MSGRTIAFGDVHGCVHALDAILGAIHPRAEDALIFLGDVIDFGHETSAVLDRLLELCTTCNATLIAGNHEQMMLEAIADEGARNSWMMFGGHSTLNSYRFGAGIDIIPDEHIDLVSTAVPFFQTDSHIFVHANYDPQLALWQQPEFELRWSLLEEPYPAPHRSGKTVIVGHTEQRNGEILDLGHVVCIDTYCRGYGWLTALDVGTGQTWQASRFGALREAEAVEPLRHLKQQMDSTTQAPVVS